MGQELRSKLIDYWINNEVKKEIEYSILTNIIHSGENFKQISSKKK